LPDPLAAAPGHRTAAAAAAPAPRSRRLRPSRAQQRPPEVALAALMLLPLFPLAAGRRRCRDPTNRRLPCSDVRPGAYPREENVFQGSLCKKKFFFLFVFQASKLAKSI